MISSSLNIQALEHQRQAHIALFEIGHSRHDLLIGHAVAGLLQLDSQIRQFLGMGGIVTGHILHQRHQFFHGGMLAATSAAGALTAAVVGMGMLRTLGVEVVVVMGMLVGMLMGMGMLMAVGHTVMGVLVGMGMGMLVVMIVMMTADMIVMQMHKYRSFSFFFVL